MIGRANVSHDPSCGHISCVSFAPDMKDSGGQEKKERAIPSPNMDNKGLRMAKKGPHELPGHVSIMATGGEAGGRNLDAAAVPPAREKKFAPTPTFAPEVAGYPYPRI